jgi:uncharacterized repeat protein (TIGR03803 family)
MRCRTISVGLTCLILAMLATGAWAAPKYKVLYTFTGGSDGGNSESPLLFDKAGNLYGTTFSGGISGCYGGYGCGVVFELTPASGGWAQSVLYAFTAGADGDNPSYGGLVSDVNGNLYGTTDIGGTGCEGDGCGTVFELARGSAGWTESVLYSFTETSGKNPTSAVAFDSKGHLYNTASGGGQYEAGTIVELIKAKDGIWNETTLFSFDDMKGEGEYPIAGLIADAKGNFYGTTSNGGGEANGGTVFELTHSGTVKVLYTFKCGTNRCNSKDAGNPWSALVFDQHGNLYGSSSFGGTHPKYGAIYKLTPSKGGTWKESVLHSFKGGRGDGAQPLGSLVFDKAGNLYGTTQQGGINSNGVVFKLTPSAGGRWKETVLHRFTGGRDGGHSSAGLVVDATGHLYGTTFEGGGTSGCFGDYGCGVVFEITP